MTELLETLFTYACENQGAQTKEYHLERDRYGTLAEQARKELTRLLSEEGQRHFADYIRAETQLQTQELETMFRAALSIGLELSRL